MKTCTKCGIEKPLSDYYKRKDTKDGFRSDCKSCKDSSNKKWLEVNSKRKQETNKTWRIRNEDRLKQLQQDWYKKNKKRHNHLQKIWAKANVETCRARDAKRRATLNKAITSTTCLSTIKDIYKNCPDGYEVDHIVPLANKGKHHQDNLCYLPMSLNRTKGAKILEDYPELLKQFNEQVIYPNIKA